MTEPNRYLGPVARTARGLVAMHLGALSLNRRIARIAKQAGDQFEYAAAIYRAERALIMARSARRYLPMRAIP